MKKGKKEKIEKTLSLLSDLGISLSACNSNSIVGEIVQEVRETTYVIRQELLCLCEKEVVPLEKSYSNVAKFQMDIKDFEKRCLEILNEVPYIKYQVVFMPYSSAMWDSFASIYKAVSKEVDVEILVVPIPYWGVDSQRQFTEVFYEKDEFPKELPIVDYRDINMDELNPDVVFIHNPYDEYNTLTRVFPEFYSSNLRKKTKHLVYIPYYLSDKKTTNDQAFMPGVRNSWRVYVQSEFIRKQMIEMGNDEKKIRAFGSPKIDDLLESVDEKDFPADWKEKIVGKKVFALITTIISVLNRPHIFLEKLTNIYDYFSERDDIAVIWRPHPHTAKQLEGVNRVKYLALVEKFSKLKNGVVDTMPDNHLALKVCDAYIGERSSMLTLFKITGKPVYVLNWRTNYLEERERPAHINSIACVGNKVVGIENNYKAMFLLDMENKSIKFFCGFKDASKNDFFTLWKGVAYQDDTVFVAAAASEKDIVLNTLTGKIVEIDSLRKNTEVGAKNVDVAIVGSNVYKFPLLDEPIIQIDLQNFSQREIQINYAQVEKYLIDDAPFTWHFGKAERSNYWLGSKRMNAIVCVNEKEETHIYPIEDVKFGLSDALFEDGLLYLLPNKSGDIIEFDISKKTFKETKILHSIMQTSSHGILKFAKYDSKWILVKAGQIVVYDEETMLKSEFNTAGILFLLMKKIGDNLFFFAVNSEFYGKYDFNKNSFEMNMFMINKDEQDNIKSCFYEKRRLAGTEDYFYLEDISSLNSFIQDVLEEKQVEVEYSGIMDENLGWVDGSCGTRIWEDIKQELYK